MVTISYNEVSFCIIVSVVMFNIWTLRVYFLRGRLPDEINLRIFQNFLLLVIS